MSISDLLAAIQNPVLPPTIYEMPYLDDGAAATRAASGAGRADVESGAVDDLTREPRLPHQNTVRAYVMELPEVIGQRAYAILAARNARTLTAPFTPSTMATGWKAMSLRTRIVVAVAFVLEAVFGSRMAERLAGSADYISWFVGLAIAAVLTTTALAIAHAIHTHYGGLLDAKGMWVALGVAVLAGVFLGLYAWGLGGGAEAVTTSGGLDGGTVVGEGVTSDDPSENWALALIYGGLFLLLLSTVMLSHLLDLHHEEMARVDQDMASRKQVLSPPEQDALALKLLRQTLILNEQAKHRGRGLLMAYVGGARSVLPPGINSAWNTADLEKLEIPDPAWVKVIRAEIERHDGERGDGDGPDNGHDPPLTLVS